MTTCTYFHIFVIRPLDRLNTTMRGGKIVFYFSMLYSSREWGINVCLYQEWRLH
jgi:hypothetical protein